MKYSRKLLSAVLAVLMIMTVLPVSALAENRNSVSQREALIYITVALQGNFQKGNDGTLMAEVPVVVRDTDGNNAVTVKEALEQVHSRYCPNGFGVKNEKCGPVISRLWNHPVENADFYVNNEKGFALRDKLNFYDSLYVFSEKSAVDTYTYFNKTDDQAVTYREYDVQLLSQDYDDSGKPISVPIANAELYAVRSDGTWKDLHVKTDEEGNAALIFREAGDVILTAKPPQKNMVSPVLKLKVANGILSMVLGKNK